MSSIAGPAMILPKVSIRLEIYDVNHVHLQTNKLLGNFTSTIFMQFCQNTLTNIGGKYIIATDEHNPDLRLFIAKS